MTTGLQLALLAGALIGGGLALLVWQLIPAQPDLADALTRLDPSGPTPTVAVTAAGDGRERLGGWALRVLPPRIWGVVPAADLAVLRKSLSRFYGEKVVAFIVGVLLPPAFMVLFTVLGWSIPVVIPAAGSLVCGVGMFLLPNIELREEAKKAREEFRRALVAYYELVALERLGASGHRQAMTNAAAVGDSWIFTRLREELARSAWAGLGPWDVLTEMSTQYDVTELADLAQAMKLSGAEGTQVAHALRARAAALRSALLSEDMTHANQVGERMSIPMSLLGVIFMALILAPALLRVLEGG